MTDDLNKQYFSEINNHLATIIREITLSQDDFRELVGEELKEEASLISNIQEDIGVIKKMLNEKEELQKKQEKNANDRIVELDKKINNIDRNIKSKIDELPFGVSGFSSPLMYSDIKPLTLETIGYGLDHDSLYPAYTAGSITGSSIMREYNLGKKTKS